MNKITLISGGGRSGKSRHALSLALGYSGRRVFVATAEALDDEIRDRIGKHRAERGDAFITVEEPLDPARALKSLPGDITVAVVDCLTVWLGNLMHHRGSSNERYTEVDSLMSILSNPSCNLIMVTNEVGMGIIPH
ncbi:MAG: bifunctional adenosylcobinamide kinase/adenosylcobinamide-phosphate guanylyltransferase, partial [Desulfomonilia bacterium]